MKYNLVPKSEIERAKSDRQIIQDTASQVIKDFARFGMNIRFPENLEYAYDSLFEQLKTVLSGLLQNDPEKLSSLLYHIDLDERKMRESRKDIINENEWLSELILEREFIKVLTRHYFKNLNNKT
jgi:hypothetical protein